MKKPFLSLIVFCFTLSVIFTAGPITGAHPLGYTQQIIRGNMNFKIGQNYTPHDPIEINGDTDLNQTALNEGWAGTGVENDPYIISNYFISQAAPSLSASIVITLVSLHVVVTNNLLSSSADKTNTGVYIQSAINVSILDNEIRNYYRGVIVEFSNNITVKSNLITNNRYGIYVWGTDNGLFASNTITNSSSYAISIRQSETINFHSNIIRYSNLVDTFDFNIISETDSVFIYNNTFEFSYVNSLFLVNCNQAQITWNQFYDHSSALAIYLSDMNNITKNRFSNTENIPNLSLEQSTNNIISSNNFYTPPTSDNHIIFFNALGNLFFNNNRGNYWSKYTGNDTNGDGIGETPFTLDSSNSDPYPLVKPVDFANPEITDYSTDLNFSSSDNVSITWTAFDQNPTTYDLYQNGTFNMTGPFDNGTNTIELGQLKAGTYIFTVTLYDKDDNTAAFITKVKITPAAEGQAAEEILNFISENIIAIAGITIISVVSLFILLKVLRKIR